MTIPAPVEDLWASVLGLLEDDDRITPQLHGFLNLVEPKGVLAGTLYLEVPNDLTRGMLEQRIRVPITEAVSRLGDDSVANFAITVNPELTPEPRTDPVVPAYAASAPVPPMEQGTAPRQYVEAPFVPAPVDNPSSAGRPDSRLNPKYNFDNFVIGGSNRFAHAAAVAVAEAPAKAYNPLFIYGDSGLGKTHLLHAIGHYAESLYPGIRVRYVSSEEFTNDFINSIANNRSAQFQQRYRDIDILLIDDIQFLQGKDSTQEAFFHTFNTLHDHNKQVVITSDLPPKHLTGFEDRMRSRFEWGLITDVQAPDLETRIAILRKKAQSDHLQVRDDILEFMASKVSSNIRELEGTLIRVTAFASLNRTEVDMALVQTVLKDLITLDEDNVIAPVDIITHTADYFKLSVDDLYGSSRSQAIATARQIAMYLCREMTSLSLPKIGQLFGNRDHTTVMYANKKITELMKERRSIYNQVTELTSRIKQDRRYK
ncbi:MULTISPECIES: chromosomal replication initiator protein DnaA [unclassified Curtobacterium]|uniref:chromosomal replication initiator protein DnaA n=1 Tax=unclassified Curtobacterium TaxID=257496 RepID=UPI000DAA0273|nr:MULTISPECIES: chromosomal replication initiator protein DnaA [unclassified Curtobacterium]PZE25995.1 chromosomal replication initiator protein DnaA [Curtobacterium sp. MCBD17_028]PZF61574.1 chromosomal replication initiator protein DnaA [Curtobacterium sp. MCBD17_013]PZF61988.1 chromosomal replication initiator protein DnaA [Curtobacterium sp. MCBD17_034]PZM34078.1 chromosomal replication initiator protein DnaA [Curtobacterium sp. MCBD17_031]WIB63609.1 chromosomal replication initiator prot